MVIEKNGKIYTVAELKDKWKVENKNSKLSVAFDVSKELCSTADELREYVLNNDLF